MNILEPPADFRHFSHRMVQGCIICIKALIIEWVLALTTGMISRLMLYRGTNGKSKEPSQPITTLTISYSMLIATEKEIYLENLRALMLVTIPCFNRIKSQLSRNSMLQDSWLVKSTWEVTATVVGVLHQRPLLQEVGWTLRDQSCMMLYKAQTRIKLML